jgi:CTP synthase
MTKYIFITGGVTSSLGKGITAASLGMLLERMGLQVRLQKFDPYLNVDPGTMSPYQHGEVYVLEDGSETDLDLGHYERFTNAPVTRECNYTTGQIYLSVIKKERKGDYLGQTVQVIPHVTDEIKAAIRSVASEGVDVVITEIGGTVGDIEGLPFLEAIRQFGLEVGRSHCLYIHLTLVPYLKAAGEAKTKPTQHSVQKLREIGIQPDILICRTEVALQEEERRKIALFCNVDLEAVVEERDKEYTIYEVPLSLARNRLPELVARRLGLEVRPIDLTDWEELVRRATHPKHSVVVAVVGKYARHKDAYKSLYEALDHAGLAHEARVVVRRVESEELEVRSPEELLSAVDGILVPGGFGIRGTEGKMVAIQYAREQGIPFFGICLGMQCAVVEFARHVIGLPGANSTEFNPSTRSPVICLMEEQKRVTALGGTMRLGAYPCKLVPGTRAAQAYGVEVVSERHRHRYEFNTAYRELFEKHGMLVSGTSPDGQLVEIVELRDHPWFVAVQFHPEFRSKPNRPHPLFSGFVRAALDYRALREPAPSVQPTTSR